MRVAPRLTVSTAEAAIDAAAAASGITRVLSYQAVDALARGDVVQVLGVIRRGRNAGASALSGRRAPAAEAARLRRFRGAALAPCGWRRSRGTARVSRRPQLLARSPCGTFRRSSPCSSQAIESAPGLVRLTLAELRNVGAAGGALLRRALRESAQVGRTTRATASTVKRRGDIRQSFVRSDGGVNSANRVAFVTDVRNLTIFPVRRALLDERADAFLGIARQHVLHHHVGGVAIGIGESSFRAGDRTLPCRSSP